MLGSSNNHRTGGGQTLITTLSTTVTPPSGYWIDICSNGTDWVMITNTGHSAVSTDLISWTTSTIPVGGPGSFGTLTAVCSNGSIYVAVESGGTTIQPTNKCYTSTDGITWTARNISSGHYVDVCSNGSLFVALSQSPFTSAIAPSSTDGLTWIPRSLPTTSGSEDPISIASDGTGFAVIYDDTSSGGTSAAYSSNGLTWTGTTFPSGVWQDITSDGTRFVALGGLKPAVDYSTAYSINGGATWTADAIQSIGGGATTLSSNQELIIAGGGHMYYMTKNGTDWYFYTTVYNISKISGKGLPFNNTGNVFGGINAAGTAALKIILT